MRDWIIRCGSTRCNHIGHENDLVPRKTKTPHVTQLVCPKCGCKSYSKATPAEVERFNAQQSRDLRVMPQPEAPDWVY